MTMHTIEPSRISWKQDYRERVNPELMTRLLRNAIPILKEADWRVTKVEEGYCETLLPLITATTNQHGTHQAALISLSADYTGGLALATLLRGVPLAGVHQCRDTDSASLWLAGMNVKYRNPSSGHLTAVCQVDPKQAEQIKTRYFRGGRVLAALQVQFYANGELVSEAEMKYFAQPTISLTPTAESPRRSTLFNHKLKASARLIAGLRTKNSSNPRIRIECPHSGLVAGPHGELLADQLQRTLPQLKEMVLARTQHIDETLTGIPELAQVVLAGAGLDMRPLRYAKTHPGITFFELDLPEMIAERERTIKLVPGVEEARRVPISADFRLDDLRALLLREPQFDSTRPTMFIYEGCSMYFSLEENQRILGSMLSLMHNPESTLWCDVVSSSVVSRRTNSRQILQFLEGMDALGESFIFGADDPCEFLRSVGFGSVWSETVAEYLTEKDAVLSTYAFAVARNSEQSVSHPKPK